MSSKEVKLSERRQLRLVLGFAQTSRAADLAGEQTLPQMRDAVCPIWAQARCVHVTCNGIQRGPCNFNEDGDIRKKCRLQRNARIRGERATASRPTRADVR